MRPTPEEKISFALRSALSADFILPAVCEKYRVHRTCFVASPQATSARRRSHLKYQIKTAGKL